MPQLHLDLPNIRLGEITKDNIEQLRILNTTIFPVQYSDKFYHDIVRIQSYAPVTRIKVLSGKSVSPIQVEKNSTANTNVNNTSAPLI
jgi:hypothetical protein